MTALFHDLWISDTGLRLMGVLILAGWANGLLLGWLLWYSRLRKLRACLLPLCATLAEQGAQLAAQFEASERMAQLVIEHQLEARVDATRKAGAA